MFRVNPSSGIPLYLQLMEQVKHAVETGALREGDRLPTIRKVAEDLVMNPNTVVRAYRELEHEGVLELKHGSGAFIKEPSSGRARNTGMPVRIVSRALLRIGENAIGFSRFLEFLFGFGVARIAIGMKLQSKLAIGALEFLLAHAAADGQNFVIVAFNGRHRNSLLVKS